MMARSRASAKQAGTRFESAIVDALKAHGWPHVERRAKTGAKDRGDITGIPGVVIEAKDTAKFEPARFLTEAQTERDNDGADIGVAWIKRRGKSDAANAYVLMDGRTLMHLLKAAGY